MIVKFLDIRHLIKKSHHMISIHVGQAGVKVGESCWEMFCQEHDVQPDGTTNPSSYFQDSNYQCFHETEDGRNIPRSVFIDLDPDSIDDIRTGIYRNLFNPDQLISGHEDASSIYSRGRYITGQAVIEAVLDQIRKQVDQCSFISKFYIYHSLGGGTGSGFSSLLLDRLSAEYEKKTFHEFTISPSAQFSTSVVEPYNAVLANHAMIDKSDASFMFENEQIFDICKNKNDIDHPTFSNLNEVISRVVSSITTSLGFDDEKSACANFMSCFSRIHFPVCSFAPMLNAYRTRCMTISVEEMTDLLFKQSSMMVNCDFNHGKCLSCSFLYCGDVIPRNIMDAVRNVKDRMKIRFTSFSNDLKIGLNYHPPGFNQSGDLAREQRVACMVANSTSIVDVWRRLGHKFDSMFEKRAFIHHFVSEGMEESEFNESREDLKHLIDEYEEIFSEQEE